MIKIQVPFLFISYLLRWKYSTSEKSITLIYYYSTSYKVIWKEESKSILFLGSFVKLAMVIYIWFLMWYLSWVWLWYAFNYLFWAMSWNYLFIVRISGVYISRWDIRDKITYNKIEQPCNKKDKPWPSKIDTQPLQISYGIKNSTWDTAVANKLWCQEFKLTHSRCK